MCCCPAWRACLWRAFTEPVIYPVWRKAACAPTEALQPSQRPQATAGERRNQHGRRTPVSLGRRIWVGQRLSSAARTGSSLACIPPSRFTLRLDHVCPAQPRSRAAFRYALRRLHRGHKPAPRPGVWTTATGDTARSSAAWPGARRRRSWSSAAAKAASMAVAASASVVIRDRSARSPRTAAPISGNGWRVA